MTESSASLLNVVNLIIDNTQNAEVCNALFSFSLHEGYQLLENKNCYQEGYGSR